MHQRARCYTRPLRLHAGGACPHPTTTTCCWLTRLSVPGETPPYDTGRYRQHCTQVQGEVSDSRRQGPSARARRSATSKLCTDNQKADSVTKRQNVSRGGFRPCCFSAISNGATVSGRVRPTGPRERGVRENPRTAPRAHPAERILIAHPTRANIATGSPDVALTDNVPAIAHGHV